MLRLRSASWTPGLLGLGLFALFGCQDYLFEQKCPEAIKESTVSKAAAKPTPADILFIVDNSGSMADEQENLARNFDRFINALVGTDDYRIAVVTTDQFNAFEMEGLVTFTFAQSHPNHLLTSDSASVCQRTNIPKGCFRGPDPSRRVIDATTLDDATVIEAFQQNVRVGSCGSGNETGLLGMISALQQAQSGCNAGFLRDEANLVVIVVTDEEDEDFADHRPIPIDQHLEALARIKPLEKVRFAAIVGAVDGEASNCNPNRGAACGSLCSMPLPEGSNRSCVRNSDCPSGEFCSSGRCETRERQYWNYCYWCSYYDVPDCCSALAGSRYVDFARLFEVRAAEADRSLAITSCRGGNQGERIACLIDSICQENFGDTLVRIARDLVAPREYVLDPPAEYPPGVVARILGGRFGEAGQILVQGMHFEVDPAGRTLKLIDEDKVVREGERIDISYVTEREDSSSNPRGACGLPE